MGQTAVKTQASGKRIKNFNEVSLGYSKKLVLDEARRCPQCVDPVCTRGCPLGINIPGFIRSLREGDVGGAYAKIRENNGLASICGRICPAPCEVACVLTEEKAPIGVRALERYTSDYGRSKKNRRHAGISNGKKIAVIGSGPAGMTGATELALRGYQVTVFEAFDKPGGILRYGIPEFRIPRKVLDAEIRELKALGVIIKTNFLIGHTETIEDLWKKGFSAILLATGAGIPKFMDLPGVNSGGVYYGEEFLMRINRSQTSLFARKVDKLPLGHRVAVIGSGNTAMDCARAAVRLGREVTLIFRRTQEDMYVKQEEIQFAKEEGISFEPMVKPIAILPDSHHFVKGLKCVRMDYADRDGSGQWHILQVPDSDFVIEVDTVVIAIGHQPNALMTRYLPQLKVNRDGTIKINEKTGKSSVPGIFAAGNVRTNAGPVVGAIASGKKAAAEIDAYLKKGAPGSAGELVNDGRSQDD